MRALGSATARRLLVYLDAERFAGKTSRRLVDEPRLTTLGIVAAKPYHQRATLRRAAAEITRAANRYLSVSLEPGERREEHRLAPERPSEAPTRIARERGNQGYQVARSRAEPDPELMRVMGSGWCRRPNSPSGAKATFT